MLFALGLPDFMHLFLFIYAFDGDVFWGFLFVFRLELPAA